MFQSTPASHAEFIKIIQDSVSPNFTYPLNNLINEKNDFFIGKKGGPTAVGANYYIGSEASASDYCTNIRNASGFPMNPSPYRLNLKVAVLIDPSGPVVNNSPTHFFVARKKYKDSRSGQLLNSSFTLPGVPRSRYFYCDFPKGSVTQGQIVNKNTSTDITAPIDTWPELRQILVAACYNEVREEGRLSELDWEITGVYPELLCEGHEFKNNIHTWNLFFVFFGTITDHIRLYSNTAGTILRTLPASQDVLIKELTARAETNLLNSRLPASYKERGTIQVVTPGVTDPNTWLRTPSHESLIYFNLLHLT